MNGELANCKNCGAPLKRYPCKCEYCGTMYGTIDELGEVRLYADGEVIIRAISAGIMSLAEARSMLGVRRLC